MSAARAPVRSRSCGRVPVLVLVLATALNAAPSPADGDATTAAAGYLVSRQRGDGGFFTDGAHADTVAEVVAALASAGVSGEPVRRALGFVAARGPERAEAGPGIAGRIVLGIVAAGEDPRSFGGVDFVARIERAYNPITGAYDADGLYRNALAALGFVAAGEELPARAIDYVTTNQCTAGGWSFRPGCVGTPDVDTTAACLSVLLAAGLGRDHPSLARARSYLAGARNPDGGFGYQAGAPTNANSTGLALSAIAGLGEDPRRAPWRDRDGSDPARALLALQAPSGGFRYLRDDERANDYATVQALPGIAGRAYPIRPVRAPEPARARSSEVPAARAEPSATRSARADAPSHRRAAPATAPVGPGAVPDEDGTRALGAPAARDGTDRRGALALVFVLAVLATAFAIARARGRLR